MNAVEHKVAIHELLSEYCDDKGYIGKALHAKLLAKGVELITKVRKNMKPVWRSPFVQTILKRHSLIETVMPNKPCLPVRTGAQDGCDADLIPN